MFIVAFLNSPKWTQHRCTSTDRWMHICGLSIQYSNTDDAGKHDSEWIQSQKTTCCIIYDSIYISCPKQANLQAQKLDLWQLVVDQGLRIMRSGQPFLNEIEQNRTYLNISAQVPFPQEVFPQQVKSDCLGVFCSNKHS